MEVVDRETADPARLASRRLTQMADCMDDCHERRHDEGVSRLPELPRRPPLAAQRALDEVQQPAILLDDDYRILAANAAYAAHYGVTPALGHDRCFAVSHGYDSPCDENGEDCPLRRARASEQRERVFHVHVGPEGPEHVDVDMKPFVDGDGRLYLEVITPIREASAHADGAFVGRSPAFLELLGLLRRGAPSDVPVLLLGESGTGKELAARAIHDASLRARGDFVAVECSGLGESLFESELFGHAKGAFTGAHARKPGLVEAATGGTLFLDEIGDVPLALQVKLLRLLESGTYRPVGDVQARRADFRLVCATHRDLDAMVAEGTFRQDLYYRISAFPIALPPLRERRDDVSLLCEALLRTSGKHLNDDALDALLRHDYPGNVRELRNVLERAVLLADGDQIEPRHLPAHIQRAGTPTDAREPARSGGGPWPWGEGLVELAEVERRYLAWAEARFDGDRRALARALGLSERTLYRKLQATRD